MGTAAQIEQMNSNTSSKTDDLWSIFTFGAKAYIDKETRADDRHVPGVEDQYYGSGYSQYQGQQAGINPQTLLLVGAAAVVVFLIAKRMG